MSACGKFNLTLILYLTLFPVGYFQAGCNKNWVSPFYFCKLNFKYLHLFRRNGWCGLTYLEEKKKKKKLIWKPAYFRASPVLRRPVVFRHGMNYTVLIVTWSREIVHWLRIPVCKCNIIFLSVIHRTQPRRTPLLSLRKKLSGAIHP